MPENFDIQSPVIIGGVGGSGTRVVAAIIAQVGFYLGSDLSPEMDNQLFMLLFKRPGWYRKARLSSKKIFTGLSLLSKAMILRETFSFAEIRFLLEAVLGMFLAGHNHMGDGRGIWPFVRAWKLLTTKPNVRSKCVGWGWKEPNSHLYLEHMSSYFKKLRYIHTIRHGLDMAFSGNQQQLYNWAPFFGVEIPKSKTDIPKSMLAYWARANRQVLAIGERLGRQKFLIVNFDRLCLSPESEIQKIISFLNIRPDAKALDLAYQIPQPPKSLGRYKKYCIGQFDQADLDELARWGYSINASSQNA
ncbi:MAG: sulfotransferase [Deltaproteobacteria bacterium]|nr:MAG: sulfotransferase [Deltaproteobacteria bacterium]